MFEMTEHFTVSMKIPCQERGHNFPQMKDHWQPNKPLIIKKNPENSSPFIVYHVSCSSP